MTSLLDQCKRHPKYGYAVIPGSIAVQLSPPEFRLLAPAQRGWVDKVRRAQGLPPYGKQPPTNSSLITPAKDQLVAAVQEQRELDREEPEKVRDPKAKRPKPSQRPKKGF